MYMNEEWRLGPVCFLSELSVIHALRRAELVPRRNFRLEEIRKSGVFKWSTFGMIRAIKKFNSGSEGKTHLPRMCITFA